MNHITTPHIMTSIRKDLINDIINDVNAFFNTEHTTLEQAIDQVYSTMDTSPDRVFLKALTEYPDLTTDERWFEETIMESLRRIFTSHDHHVLTKLKHMALVGIGFELYKQMKDPQYVPNVRILQTNVGMMGFAWFTHMMYTPKHTMEDFKLIAVNSISLFIAGLDVPNVENGFTEDEDRYLKVHIYNLLAMYLINDTFNTSRIELCKCLLDPLLYNEPYFVQRAKQLIHWLSHSYDPEYIAQWPALRKIDRETVEIRRKLGAHFIRLGIRALFE
jgi:hypothetical protein